jgi:hypothetical protein
VNTILFVDVRQQVHRRQLRKLRVLLDHASD